MTKRKMKKILNILEVHIYLNLSFIHMSRNYESYIMICNSNLKHTEINEEDYNILKEWLK